MNNIFTMKDGGYCSQGKRAELPQDRTGFPPGNNDFLIQTRLLPSSTNSNKTSLTT
jgi:hypothetical protein